MDRVVSRAGAPSRRPFALGEGMELGEWADHAWAHQAELDAAAAEKHIVRLLAALGISKDRVEVERDHYPDELQPARAISATVDGLQFVLRDKKLCCVFLDCSAHGPVQYATIEGLSDLGFSRARWRQFVEEAEAAGRPYGCQSCSEQAARSEGAVPVRVEIPEVEYADEEPTAA